MSRASGIGSWPGTDIRTTVRLVRDLLTGTADDSRGGIPYLPELPDRGPGADLIGRSAGLLVELPVDLQPSGWRLVDRPGRDAQRTANLLRGDLDELAEVFDGYEGDLKVQVAGPWTLAASVRLPRGERVVVDPGAVRELIASLAEGVATHLTAVRRRVPGARLVLQLDEPLLPDVLRGTLPTSSGFGRLRPVEAAQAASGLRQVLAAQDGASLAGVGVGTETGTEAGTRAARTVVHCCARNVPLPVLRQAGVDAVALDVRLLGSAGWESVAATVEAGVGLWAGVVPTHRTDWSRQDLVSLIQRPWQDVGLSPSGLSDVVATPACGLAGLGPDAAVAVQRAAADAAGALSEVSAH